MGGGAKKFISPISLIYTIKADFGVLLLLPMMMIIMMIAHDGSDFAAKGNGDGNADGVDGAGNGDADEDDNGDDDGELFANPCMAL